MAFYLARVRSSDLLGGTGPCLRSDDDFAACGASLLAAKSPSRGFDAIRCLTNLLEPDEPIKERLSSLRRATVLVAIQATLNLVIEIRKRNFGKNLLIGDLEKLAAQSAT